MGGLIIGLFSPFILMAFILIAFSMLVGINPESALKPFFGLVAAVLRSLISLFILGIKLTLQGSGQMPVPLKPFKFSDNNSNTYSNSQANPEIRIVKSED